MVMVADGLYKKTVATRSAVLYKVLDRRNVGLSFYVYMYNLVPLYVGSSKENCI